VQWKQLRLASKTAGSGYGETALPVEEKLKEMFPGIKADSKPCVVWICDVSDEKEMRSLDGKIFKNENIGMALMRFNCFRVNVLEIPDGDLKDKYMRSLPAFEFYDPAAKLVTRSAGRRAGSLSRFSKSVDKCWKATFDMSLKKFQKGMKDILDRLDRYETKKQVFDKKAARLEERPNPRLKRQLDEERVELDEMRASIEKDEKEFLASCSLKPEFLPEGEQDPR
jgi:hypothetical protein